MSKRYEVRWVDNIEICTCRRPVIYDTKMNRSIKNDNILHIFTDLLNKKSEKK